MIDEGTIKFHSEWTGSSPLKIAELSELQEWRQRLFEKELIGYLQEHDVGYGNLSARVGSSDQFVISGTQTGHIAETGPEHFSLVTNYDIDTNTVWSTGPIEASSESLTHAAIFGLAATIGAVVHVHSEKLWVGLKDVLPTTGDNVAYGTPQMAREFCRLYNETTFADDGVAVMAGHEGGLISFGDSLQEAAERILAFENGGPQLKSE